MTVKRDARGRKRDYKKEYKRDQAGRPAKKNRAARNKAARKKKCGPGREADHKRPLSKGGSKKMKNVRCVSRRTNRRKSNK